MDVGRKWRVQPGEIGKRLWVGGLVNLKSRKGRKGAGRGSKKKKVRAVKLAAANGKRRDGEDEEGCRASRGLPVACGERGRSSGVIA